jgi:hypothetical protein
MLPESQPPSAKKPARAAPGLTAAPSKPLAPQPKNGWYKPLGSDTHHFFTRHVAICGKHLAGGDRIAHPAVPAGSHCPECLAELARAAGNAGVPPASAS